MLTEAGPLNGMHDEDIEQMIHKLDPQNEELMKSFEVNRVKGRSLLFSCKRTEETLSFTNHRRITWVFF